MLPESAAEELAAGQNRSAKKVSALKWVVKSGASGGVGFVGFGFFGDFFYGFRWRLYLTRMVFILEIVLLFW